MTDLSAYVKDCMLQKCFIQNTNYEFNNNYCLTKFNKYKLIQIKRTLIRY